MELILTRIAKKKTYTIGRLYIRHTEGTEVTENNRTVVQDQVAGETTSVNSITSVNSVRGMEYLCDTLEPTWRDYQHGGRKIKGRSAIPEGRYAVVISWSPKMKAWLPILIGVPNFSGIRIHAGNTAKDTEGCILVGQNLKMGMVVNSRIWLHRLKQKIVEAKSRGEAVWITVR